MKSTVDRSLFLEALTAANLAVEKKSTIPILQNVKITAGSQAMTVTGTDLEVAIEQYFPAYTDEPFVVTLPAAMLTKVLRSSKVANVTVEVVEGCTTKTETCQSCKGKGKYDPVAGVAGAKPSDCPPCDGKGTITTQLPGKVRVTAGASVTLESLTPDSYPALPEFGGPKFPVLSLLETTTADWNDMCAKVAYAISAEESRFTLNGFLLEVSDKVYAVATDGHRLALVERGESVEREEKYYSVVPKRVAGYVKSIFGKASEPLTVMRTEPKKSEADYLILASGRTVIVSRLLNGNFPDWRRVIPDYGAGAAEIKAADLIAAIDGIKHCADERSGAIRLEFNCAATRVVAESADLGKAEMEIACECNAASNLTFGINHSYLYQFLKSLPKEETVYLEVKDGKSAMGFHTGTDSGLRHVIMPLRLK
jgi:DNA polymerase-3 subunit beta